LRKAEADSRTASGNSSWAKLALLEIESDVIAAFDLKYCTQTDAAELTARIKKALQVLNGLLRSTMRGFKDKKFKPVNG